MWFRVDIQTGIRFAGQCLGFLCLSVIAGLSFSSVGYSAEKPSKINHPKQQKRLKVNPLTDNEEAWVANAETNVYAAGTFENLTLGYSALKGWDFSISLLNTQMLGPNNQFVADTFFNIAKTFEISDEFDLMIGSHNGLALVNTQPQVWYSFSFLDARYTVTPWLLLHGGSYLANAAITNSVRQIGFLVGSEITLVDNTLTLQMDYLNGHHALSGATANLLFNITTHVQVYLGVGVPEQGSGNEFAGIIGFNFSTKSL